MADSQRTGEQSIQSYSLEQLRLLLGKEGLSDLATPETGALTQLESWVMDNPTPTTLDRATMWMNIWQELSNSGLSKQAIAQVARYAIHVVYPQYDWQLTVGERGQVRLQARMRPEE